MGSCSLGSTGTPQRGKSSAFDFKKTATYDESQVAVYGGGGLWRRRELHPRPEKLW